jgi:TPR repeat protein
MQESSNDLSPEMIKTAAEQGDLDAQFQLGWKYLTGDGLPQSFIQAAQWFRTAAELGQLDAQYQLGLRYEQGEGVRQDAKQAWLWIMKAADQGHLEAQQKLEQDRRKRHGKIAELIQQWIDEDDGYDERVWPEIERALRKSSDLYANDPVETLNETVT